MNISLVREILKKKKLTQKEFSIMSGVSKAQINNILTGRSEPEIKTIEKIAKALGLQVNVLLSPEPLSIQNGQVNNIHGTVSGTIHNMGGDRSTMYMSTDAIEALKRENEGLRELVKSKDETIASLKMTIEAIKGGG